MNRKADDDVGMAIEITALCETLHCLPRAGGLFDQDPLVVYMMREVIVAQREKEDIQSRQKGMRTHGA